jgi:hypothetical protein
MNKPMKHHLLLCLTILPLWTASAAILSPNKVQELGLADAFKQLLYALFKIDAAIFEVMGS